MSHSWDTELDEDEANSRVYPVWSRYQKIFERRGFRLDTCLDVKRHYEQYCSVDSRSGMFGYLRACSVTDENALCNDPGLPDNLFRGSRVQDGKNIVVKAVRLSSREFDIVRFLSTPSRRQDPNNHCIPVLDTISIAADNIGMIVMEEWSPRLMTDKPCCLRLFLGALQQCIDHIVFMHRQRIAHLDISLHNFLTDHEGHYACIDYEQSRRYDNSSTVPQMQYYRAAEIPPELERGESSDPFKVDVWALGVFILRACKLTGYHVPELLQISKPMLHENPNRRPSATMVQKAFDLMVTEIGEARLHDCIMTP